MTTTSLEFTSFHPGVGPVEIEIDDDVAAELLSQDGPMERSARRSSTSLERTAGLAAAMTSVWRAHGVVDLRRVAELVETRYRRPDPSRDPFEPRVGKWAAVVLREDAAEAEQSLAPLLALRAREGVAFDRHGGTPGLVIIDRPAADKPALWEQALRDAAGPPPHHLLLVGGPERFGFDVVSFWGARRIVGVLDVADEPLGPLSWSAAHRYATKVADHALGDGRSARRALVYALRTDRATRKSHDQLATPLLRYLTEQTRRFPAVEPPLALLGDAATTRALLSTLREARPALSILCTHGLEYPSDAWLWGALTSADDVAGTPLSVESLTADDPFAEGGVVFAFACFSAGIPARSDIIELVSSRRADPVQIPRTASLPRVALGKPAGPLAFVGHVDRASTSSFAGFEGPAAFEDLADFVLGGLGTVGQGMSTFWEEAMRRAADLASLLERDARSTPQQKVAAWVRRLDSAGWLLLGDPCVRLFSRRAAG